MRVYSGDDRHFIRECFDRYLGHCTECRRPLDKRAYLDLRYRGGWVILTQDGRVVGVLCADCFDRLRAASQQRQNRSPPRRREPDNIIMGKGYTFAPGHSDWHPF